MQNQKVKRRMQIARGDVLDGDLIREDGEKVGEGARISERFVPPQRLRAEFVHPQRERDENENPERNVMGARDKRTRNLLTRLRLCDH